MGNVWVKGHFVNGRSSDNLLSTIKHCVFEHFKFNKKLTLSIIADHAYGKLFHTLDILLN